MCGLNPSSDHYLTIDTIDAHTTIFCKYFTLIDQFIGNTTI